MGNYPHRAPSPAAAGLSGERPDRPESPCVTVCALDEANTCLGCGRTLEEISRWSRMDKDEQWTIIDNLPARKARRA